jgi:hypothetical protein
VQRADPRKREAARARKSVGAGRNCHAPSIGLRALLLYWPCGSTRSCSSVRP